MRGSATAKRRHSPSLVHAAFTFGLSASGIVLLPLNRLRGSPHRSPDDDRTDGASIFMRTLTLSAAMLLAGALLQPAFAADPKPDATVRTRAIEANVFLDAPIKADAP